MGQHSGGAFGGLRTVDQSEFDRGYVPTFRARPPLSRLIVGYRKQEGQYNHYLYSMVQPPEGRVYGHWTGLLP